MAPPFVAHIIAWTQSVFFTVKENELCMHPDSEEAFSHAAITARFVQISTSVGSQVFICTAELTMATWDERNYQSFEMAARGFESGFAR